MADKLSPECLALIESKEAGAAPAPHGLWAIHSDDGPIMFFVTPTISTADLGTMFGLHDRRWRYGFAAGSENAFAQIRNLIGAAPLEP